MKMGCVGSPYIFPKFYNNIIAKHLNFEGASTFVTWEVPGGSIYLRLKRVLFFIQQQKINKMKQLLHLKSYCLLIKEYYEF